MFVTLCFKSLCGSIEMSCPLQRLSEEVAGHRERMEGILSSLATLASHDKRVEPATITEYRDTLRYTYMYIYIYM